MSGLPNALKNRANISGCAYTPSGCVFVFGPSSAGIAPMKRGFRERVIMGLVELEINQVVVAIDFVTQPGNGRELVIELQNLIQLAKACSVNFQFKHRPSNYEHHTVMQKETRLRGSPS